ncbi:MAG: hypothetical protein ACPHN2_08785 [Sinimarinibacterium flocculans]|uniref:hypothetical protein n=1 Tax=Sinimarinibacterium flocculans TaxID=985250 RepID=UPI003C4481BD
MNAPVQPPLTVEQALERAIRATADLQTALHLTGVAADETALNVHEMVTRLKAMRAPETVERLDAERLALARAV